MRVLALVLLLLAFSSGETRADVDVVRRGEENPMLTVAKSTLWGAVTGLVLGGAIALVAEKNEKEILRWSVAAGTFVGFAVGIYHVATRPSATSSLIQMGGTGAALRVPGVEVDWSRELERTTVRVPIFSYGF